MIEKKEWNIQKVLNWTTQNFSEKEISSARLDAELLLANVLGCRRIDLYLKFDQPMKAEELVKYRELVQRRRQKEPVAYILGTQEFYGRSFSVGPGVLIPRPETEHIIDEALAWVKNQEPGKSFDVLDVATGSGCLAITLGKEIPTAKVTALDISSEALAYAQKNLFDLNGESNVSLICQDFLQWAQRDKNTYEIIVSNPPYISKEAGLMEDVKNFEPSLALYGGQDGSEVLRAWVPLMFEKLKAGGILLCEIGFDQSEGLKEFLAGKKISGVSFIKDYFGHNRVLKIIKE